MFRLPIAYDVIVIKKRTGEEIRGVMKDDGLQSLWPVESEDGTIHYVTVLDTFVSKTLREEGA